MLRHRFAKKLLAGSIYLLMGSGFLIARPSPCLSLCRFEKAPHTVVSPSQPQVQTATKPQKIFPLPEIGKTVEQTLAGGEIHVYQISLKAGEYLKLIVNQRGIDVLLRLYNPLGVMLIETDSLNATQGLEAVSAIAEREETFRIEVASTTKGVMAGRYEIKLDALRQASAQDRKWLAAQSAYSEGLQLLGKATEASLRSAVANFENASQLYGEAGDPIKQAHALAYIGQTADTQGQYQKSFDSYYQALQIIQKVGDIYEEANLKLSVGLAANVIGKPQWALDYGLSALALWQSIKEPTIEGLTLRLVGISYRLLGQPRKAIEYLNQALAIFNRVKDPLYQARTLRNLANAFDSIDEVQRAMECHNQALVKYQFLKDHYRQAETLVSIGRIYSRMGNSTKAFEYFNRALPAWQVIGEQSQAATTLSFIGESHAQTGAYVVALDYYKKALKMIAGTGARLEEATISRMVGDAYTAVNDPRQALQNYERALQVFQLIEYKLGEAEVLGRIGAAYNAFDEPQKALGYFKNALEMLQIIEDHQSKAFALYGIACAERKLGNLDRARAQLEATLAETEIIRSRNKDQQQLTSYLASTQKYFDEYISLLMQLHKARPTEGFDALAMQASEQARARGLLERLTEARINIYEGVDAALIEQERNLFEQFNEKADQRFALFGEKGKQEQIAALKNELSELENQLQQVKALIRTKSPRYAALTQPRSLTVSEIRQQILDNDSLLLEYSLGADRGFLWAVSQEKISTYELPEREAIEKLARRIRSLLTARSLSVSAETPIERQQRIARAESQLTLAAAKLSQLILGPVAAELKDRRLIIVPDAGIQYIPFAMLPVPAPSGTEPSRPRNLSVPEVGYQPLILRHEVINLPSASVLAVLRKENAGRQSSPKGLAIFADPVFTSDDPRLNTKVASGKPEKHSAFIRQTRILEHFSESAIGLTGRRGIPRLPFTRQEAAQILGLASGMTNLEALDFKANRALATNQALSQYRYLHFATHGYLDSEHPEESGLLLSLIDEQGKPQNGLLRAKEIFNLSLPAELVVMSACQTGLGKQSRGEGVESLTRPFMYAGAPRVIVSLWNVSDRATSDLMQRFYRGLFKEGLRPAAALRAAQLEMFKQKHWQSPYYWAAFILQGEWQ